MKIYFSESRNARKNLALEEALLGCISEPVLLLYENDPAVVIGRFQNPWCECRIGLAQRLKIPVLRRISGGGTVVHTTGNLNWAIISPSSLSADETLGKMLGILRTFNLELSLNKYHDILLHFPDEGCSRKISGSAFRQTSQGSLHHATLLVNADLHLLWQVLDVPKRDIKGNAVHSIRSKVANLNNFAPGLTTGKLLSTIVHAWAGTEKMLRISPDQFSDKTQYLQIYQRIGSQEWIWGKTAPFTEQFVGIPGCPADRLICEVKAGSIQRILLDGTEWPLLNGRFYRGKSILDSISPPHPNEPTYLEYRSTRLWLENFAALVESDDIISPSSCC